MTSSSALWKTVRAVVAFIAIANAGCSLSSPKGGQLATADACASASPCGCGHVECGGLCVDTQTDNNNCGACGTMCSAISPSTARCEAGRCLVTLASGLLNADGVAVDADSVYFTAWASSGLVARLPLDGGTPATLASGQSNPNGTVADGTNVYWITGGTAANLYEDRAVVQMPLDSGAPVTHGSGSRIIYAIAVDTTSIYSLETTANAVSGYNVSLVKTPLAGGSSTVLASAGFAPGYGLAVDTTSAYFTSEGTSANRYVHIPEASGQGFRFNVGAHSGVTWAHIPA